VFDKEGTGYIGVGELKYGTFPCLAWGSLPVDSAYESWREVD